MKKTASRTGQKSDSSHKNYAHQHWFDKSLDQVLLFSIVTGLVLLGIEIFSHPSAQFMKMVYGFDVFFIGVLFTDMTRNYLKSRSFGQFMHHHWLDLVIMAIVITSFSALWYAGLGRLSWLVREEKVIPWLLRSEEAAGEAGKVLRLGFVRKLFK